MNKQNNPTHTHTHRKNDVKKYSKIDPNMERDGCHIRRIFGRYPSTIIIIISSHHNDEKKLRENIYTPARANVYLHTHKKNKHKMNDACCLYNL